MSSIRTAPKPYRCAWCETTIKEGTQYARRSEHNGIHYVANKYHIECEQEKIKENLRWEK